MPLHMFVNPTVNCIYVGLYIEWLLYLLYYNTKKKVYINMVYGLLTCSHNNASPQKKPNKNVGDY